MTAPDRVLVEILIAVPIDIVWQALRDPAQIHRWFGWDYASLSAEIDQIFVAGASASDADHRIEFIGMSDRFTLEAHGDQTVVRLIRAAPSGAAAGWQGIYEETAEGWLTFLQQLKFALERHRGQDRRTVYLAGRARASGVTPEAALGAAGVAHVTVGQRYSLTTATGDALAGEVWFRSTYQVGLTVDRFGDGLLVITRRTQTEKSPYGGGEIVLTTYGLDDETFTRVRARWVEWWQRQFEPTSMEPQPA